MKVYPYSKKEVAISVIIPMYNAELYIAECLDSLLNQTFQDFEVIVVDDCSSDESVKIVKAYFPKFNGKLHFEKTKKNSGGGGYVPRNIGLKLARGEYVFFLDADDFILLTALETLYTVAKENKADVIYTGVYYDLRKPNDVYIHRDGAGKKLFREGKKDKITLTIDDPEKNLQELLTKEREGNFRAPWTKFVRREFLFRNRITFPETLTNGGDFIWVINVYCCAKRFLRISTPFYFYRRYSSSSVTRKKKNSRELVSYWFLAFTNFIKALVNLTNSIRILKDNPVYSFAAANSHFNFCLYLTNEARKELTNRDIYEILYREFINQNDLPGFVMPFLFSIIDADKKTDDSYLANVDNLQKEVAQLKKAIISDCPAISIIIPLYNAADYVGECLESLLEQTFQNFEVIIVDDCSTDNSVEIVEDYTSKFNGRLRIAKLEENSGSGGLPRNKGISISCGEYIQFLDADDMLIKTALEEMYSLAKNYNADVVYCEKHYIVDDDGSNPRIKSFEKGILVDKPTFESEDLNKRFDKVLKNLFVPSTCFKFTRRKLLLEHEIFFPQIRPSEDDVWTYGLIFYAKKFLRVPNSVYVRRLSKNSVMRKERTLQQKINFWLNPALLGAKSLDNLMKRNDFFKANPSCRYTLLKKIINDKFFLGFTSAQEFSENTIYEAIKEEFGKKLGEYDVLIPALCTALYNERRTNSSLELTDKFKAFFTARIDIRLMSTEGDFQIQAVSDDKAKVSQPSWLQGNAIGYMISSFAGSLKFVAKATVSGQISLNLRSMDVREPADKSKRIPYWIDYTKLVVNNKTIFNKLTPTWHDKPFRYNINAKRGEEIKIEIEWLPHRYDIIESKITTTPKETIKPNVLTANKVEKQVPHKFNPNLTARIDVKFLPKTTDGDFQILSKSDDKAEVLKPGWFQNNGIGYIIQSSKGDLSFVAKTTANGQINFNLRGMDIRSSEDWKRGIAKRIPYWIDYTKFTVNDEIIFDKLIPAWCNEPYTYTVDVKAGEEIMVKVEWLPHRSDT